ncbi:MAG TPA: hypothetical protein PLQ20_02155 [Candidatus Paceibacterota bacterium]|nr:hypothetical protein [Candidatus Paceibacterota bacterium]
MQIIILFFAKILLVVNLENKTADAKIYWQKADKGHYNNSNYGPAEIPAKTAEQIPGRKPYFFYFTKSIGKPSGKKWFPKRWIFRPALEPI